MFRIILCTTVCFSITSNAVAQCGFAHKFSQVDEGGTTSVKVYEGDAIAALGGRKPLLFITSLKVNTDGTKISYHKDDVTGRRCAVDPTDTPCAINNIRNAYIDHTQPVSKFEAVRNAGFPPSTWSVLNPNIIEKDKASGKPCITSDGYLVSMTADVAIDGGFGKVGDCDQTKWIDALTMPAIVLPKGPGGLADNFRTRGIRKRSLVIAVSKSSSKRVVEGIVGDAGPAKQLGEANIAMNRKLNGLPDTDQPKHYQDAIDRFQAEKTAVLLFGGTDFVLDRPISGNRIAEGGAEALKKFGGVDKLYECISKEVDSTF